MTERKQSVVTDELREAAERMWDFSRESGPELAAWLMLAKSSFDLIDEIDRLRAENAKLREQVERSAKGLAAVADLMDESYGVAGLHQNGDMASWQELRSGGAFAGWLENFDAAIEHCGRPNQQHTEQPPDGPITEDLCRDLGLVPLDGKAETCCMIGGGLTVFLDGMLAINADSDMLPGTWTANRLRKLIEAMRGG